MKIWMSKIDGEPVEVESDSIELTQHMMRGFKRCSPPEDAGRARKSERAEPSDGIDEEQA